MHLLSFPLLFLPPHCPEIISFMVLGMDLRQDLMCTLSPLHSASCKKWQAHTSISSSPHPSFPYKPPLWLLLVIPPTHKQAFSGKTDKTSLSCMSYYPHQRPSNKRHSPCLVPNVLLSGTLICFLVYQLVWECPLLACQISFMKKTCHFMSHKGSLPPRDISLRMLRCRTASSCCLPCHSS